MSATHGSSNVTPVDELLVKMREGIKTTTEIDCRNLKIPFRVLAIDELAAIRRESRHKTALYQGDQGDIALETQKSVLKMASTIGGAPFITDKWFQAPHGLSVDEINYLYDEYVRFMDSVNPRVEMVTPEQFRAIVDALKKNTITARDLSLRQLWAICTAYQDLILRQDTQTSPTDNKSGGRQ